MDKREELINLLKLPQSTGLKDFSVKDETRFNGYSQRLVNYYVEDEYIEAFILIPSGTGPFPGMLAIHQDGDKRPYANGKSEPAGVRGDAELAYGLELCKRGYVVICPDRFGFESRSLANSPHYGIFNEMKLLLKLQNGNQPMEIDMSEDVYRGYKANLQLIRGKTALGAELNELKASIDILESLPEVDADRIGAIGHSAGGLLSLYLMYLDRRIKAGCSSSGVADIKDFYPQDGMRLMQGFGGITTVPGIIRWGSLPDLLEGLAPRPFMEACSDVDKSGYFNKAIQKYNDSGLQGRMIFDWYDSGIHQFRKDKREVCYQFLDKWLK